jgi:agmatine/peptidylarginine deiminase
LKRWNTVRKSILFIILGSLLFVVSNVSAQEVIPREIARIPHVIPTADELANPSLYRPKYDNVYMPPNSELPPPPVDVVRPGEFDLADSTLISVLNQGTAFGEMWGSMVKVYAGVGHVWIITTTAGKAWIAPFLDTAGADPDNYSFIHYPIDSIWVRDSGPEFVVAPDGTRHVIDASYSGRALDDAIPIRVGASDWISTDGSPLDVHTHIHGLSGGNIMTDGAGTCFFSDIIYGYEKPNSWSDEDVNDHMEEYYGCKQIIVLTPIQRDSTQHIDLYAKLVDSTSILLGEFAPDTRFPEDYENQEANLAIIEATTNLDGDPWTVTRLPMLEPYKPGFGWVYRTYMNSEIFNNTVAMPSYYTVRKAKLHLGTPEETDETAEHLLNQEAAAIAAYETARPGVIVTPIDSDHIIAQGGAIHCISHEVAIESGGDWEPPEMFCGDKIINGDEECDLSEFGEATCESMGYDSGKLKCDHSCKFDVAKCAYDEPQPDGGADADADSDADTDTDTDSDADEDAGTADADSDTDTDTETDNNGDSGLVQDAGDDDSDDSSCN